MGLAELAAANDLLRVVCAAASLRLTSQKTQRERAALTHDEEREDQAAQHAVDLPHRPRLAALWRNGSRLCQAHVDTWARRRGTGFVRSDFLPKLVGQKSKRRTHPRVCEDDHDEGEEDEAEQCDHEVGADACEVVLGLEGEDDQEDGDDQGQPCAQIRSAQAQTAD